MKLRLTPSVLAVLALALTGCSTMGGESADPAATASASTRVVLVTHDSFSLPDELIASFEADTGLDLVQQSKGDGGTLTNQLVLTKDNPIGDVAFGVDNTFASRALNSDVFTAYDGPLPAGSGDYLLEGDPTLAPIDTAAVCVNVDLAWYAAQGQRPPGSFADLIKPEYRDQMVTPGASSSSPGFAWLLATIAAHGGADSQDWQGYWQALLGNGLKVAKDWEDAYYVNFTAGGKSGDRPIVVSYDSSPAFTIDPKTKKSTTHALLNTCFRQVEYAGILANAQNPTGAAKVIEWLLSPQVQAALPDSMYVFPTRSDVELPTDWAKWAIQPGITNGVSAADIDRHREEWLTAWTDLVSQ